MTAYVCALCERILPLGGVLDDKGRRVHDWCKGLAAQRVADDARATSRAIRKGGRPRTTPTLALEGATA